MGRLDLLGSDANSILHKVLHPVVRSAAWRCFSFISLLSLIRQQMKLELQICLFIFVLRCLRTSVSTNSDELSSY